jgi:hypothetical protein
MEAEMADLRKRIEGAPFAESVRLESDAILARTRLSGAGVARIEAEGELELEALQRVLLEVGGTAVAEGRILRRRGESYFKVERMLGGESKEGRK